MVAVAVSVELSGSTSTAYFEVGVTAGEVDTGCSSLILQFEIDSNEKFKCESVCGLIHLFRYTRCSHVCWFVVCCDRQRVTGVQYQYYWCVC